MTTQRASSGITFGFRWGQNTNLIAQTPANCTFARPRSAQNKAYLIKCQKETIVAAIMAASCFGVRSALTILEFIAVLEWRLIIKLRLNSLDLNASLASMLRDPAVISIVYRVTTCAEFFRY